MMDDDRDLDQLAAGGVALAIVIGIAIITAIALAATAIYSLFLSFPTGEFP